MKNRIFVILKEDIVDYPPVLSIIQVLAENSYKVIHLGNYSDQHSKDKYIRMGVEFVTMPAYNGNSNLIKKYIQQISFKNKVTDYLNKQSLSDNDIVWLIQAETIFLLSALVKKYKTICHFLEFVGPNVNWKYRIANPSLDLADTLQHAYKVVCCEYNRAQIAKGIFQLNELPAILPNKMIIDESALNMVPADISDLLNEVKGKTKGKKIILYQGIFLDKERRLEEFCEAIKELPEEFVFIAMGRGSVMYEELKKKYESNRILFIPFIKPPYHLLVTKMAYIGVLSYFPRKGTIEKTLNPLYCAPNKIFEYSRFGIPMISNDVPALRYAYMEHHCGKCVDYPMKTTQIVDTINFIINNYSSNQQGARQLYESVDISQIVKIIIGEL